MPLWKHLMADDGSASLEFITAGILLLVPLVYLVSALSVLQGAAFAAEGAARQAARVFVQSETIEQGAASAEQAAAIAFSDFGITEGIAPIEYSCEPVPDACLTRAGHVTVTVRVSVPLPLLPAFLGTENSGGIPFVARATQTVSRFHS
ncbi:hypothetical protein SAMN06295879_1006 [Agreia bicolorata]|uniref:TadE-like protein n=2 Tax=Agreia bicolorata TaxID=110935 RepID=A0A1T4XBP1_9MICO|nr:hypothetical protein SAMN06295879_1006 [Agreia bicolorata]